MLAKQHVLTTRFYLTVYNGSSLRGNYHKFKMYFYYLYANRMSQ